MNIYDGAPFFQNVRKDQMDELGIMDLKEASRRPGWVSSFPAFCQRSPPTATMLLYMAKRRWGFCYTRSTYDRPMATLSRLGGSSGSLSQRMLGSQDRLLGFGDVFRCALVAGPFVLFLR